MKSNFKIKTPSFIGELLLYLGVFIVIVNLGLQNVFFSAFASFCLLIILVFLSIIIEIALEGRILIWKDTKVKLFLNIGFIVLIFFFFIFFSPDPRLWIVSFIPIFYIFSLFLENIKKSQNI